MYAYTIIISSTGNVDYAAGPYFVDIIKGDTRVDLFIFNITDDNILEEDEHFILTIRNDTLHPDIVPMNLSANVTIMDNECKLLKL